MKQAPWKIRRRIIIVTLSLCAFVVIYLLFRGADTRLHETLANGAFFLAGSVIGAYVFGAAWDDKNSMGMQQHRPIEYEQTD